MSRIPDETIQAIRDRVDIVELVGRTVTLKSIGRSFKGLCPFHSEKTPSFHVHPERQIFHCFGCGAGGDAFRFLMQHDNLSFPEAVRALGRACGIEVPEEGGGEAGLSQRLREANEVAQRLYRRALRGPEGAAARRYLEERGLPAELVDRFGIGFAPARWDAVVGALAEAGIPAELGAKAGLLAERRGGGYYDRLRGRVTFPIRDVRGSIVGFGGRTLGSDGEPKYLNTPESPIFRKREAFYALPEALEPMRRSGRAVVVEGYFDALALHRAGLGEVVATCGTALTEDHARNLRRRTREVVLFFDGDEAGRRAMERALAVLLPERLRARAVALPAGDDPDTFLAREGAEVLRRRVDQAPAALDLLIQQTVERGCATPWQKADAVSEVARLLALIPDPVERGEFARRLALVSGTRTEEVEAVVRAARRRGRGTARGEDPDPVAVAPPRLSREEEAEVRLARRLAHLLVEHPDRARRLAGVEVDELVRVAPWDAILRELLAEAARRAEGDRLDVAGLAERLGGEPGAALRRLAVSNESVAAEEADRVFDGLVRRLRERRRAQERRALTRRLSEQSPADAAALLAEKQRQLEERRAALGITRPPGTARAPARP